MGDYPKATSIYKDIIKRNPSYVDAYLWIAFLAIRNNDLVWAMNYAKNAKEQAADKNKNTP